MNTVICQINGAFDEKRKTRLPAQCCGEPADQIYKCEQIAPPGHRHQVGDHTILHERMGNGYSCSAVDLMRNLQVSFTRGKAEGQARTSSTTVGAR